MRCQMHRQECILKSQGNLSLWRMAQAESVITREDLPAFGFRIALTLAIIAALLFAAFIYYSNISP